MVRIPAYSGKPIRTLVGFDVSGKIVGLKIVHHEEPILVVGISDKDLQNYIDQYLGLYVNDKIKVGGRDRDGYKSIDPMVFLLWGRGVYCGWLCPFGALQELIFRITERCKCPTFEFPEVVHERLWAIKYIILLGLFAISMQSLIVAEQLAEIEPFKTTFTLHFVRDWSYIIYAVVLLIISAFNRKFYCRYICPLGAALTFPSKFRIFEWLRRYKECGRPCQICRKECEVRAIRSTGEINANECHYCLDCQVTYWNAYKCPPLTEKRKKRERARKLSQ